MLGYSTDAQNKDVNAVKVVDSEQKSNPKRLRKCSEYFQKRTFLDTADLGSDTHNSLPRKISHQPTCWELRTYQPLLEHLE